MPSKRESSGIIKNRETFKIAKNLSRKEAMAQTTERLKHDHRGFIYNPRTGIAVWT